MEKGGYFVNNFMRAGSARAYRGAQILLPDLAAYFYVFF